MTENEEDIHLQMYIDNHAFKKIDNLFEDNLAVLPQFLIFILLEIGFEILEIKLIDSLLSNEKYLSYFELKSLGFSKEKISSLFYLIDHENDFFKKEILQSCCTNKDFISEECSICLNSFENSENNVKLNCGHTFHINCIAKWKSTCPYCREPFENIYQYPKLIRNWIPQCSNAIYYLDTIKQFSIKIKIGK